MTDQAIDSLNADRLLRIERLELGFLPTPLVPLDRLSERLGGPRIWLKRDDCTGLATGGNKTRKLEYLLADARARAAQVVVTFGAVQSNHARQTAAACAAVGLPCHLVLSRRVRWSHPGYESAGNVLLDRLFGARVDIVDPADVALQTRAVIDRYRERGLAPYVIPTGGSNPLGALGYARCAFELIRQAAERGFALTDVAHASSSAGTQAGLIAGFAALCNDPAARPAVHGLNVYEHDAPRLASTILTMACAVLERLVPQGARPVTESSAVGLGAAVGPDDVRLDSRYLGEDYGIPTPATLAAIRELAGTEGVLLDPVYSGKAFGGLLDRIRRGEFSDRSDLVFIHTGGTAALPVYQDAFDGMP
jgi:L-cysteate sulfo-lyase